MTNPGTRWDQLARLAQAVRDIAGDQVTTQIADSVFFAGQEKARILNAAADEFENLILEAKAMSND